MKKLVLFISFLILITLIAQAYNYDLETVKIMPFVASNEKCKLCHNKPEDAEKIRNPARADDRFCKSCHEIRVKITRKHLNLAGKRLRGNIKYSFDLAWKNRVACFTCHDLTKRRFDSTPWKSESLFEKIFSKKKRYKTYYLIMKNSEGQLCRKCHF